ncbi:MAG: VCBS repeat-containing protein, partial [Opitutales bacterium]|nr:VCBS repeat-containing protein [Opitutales bacterium]
MHTEPKHDRFRFSFLIIPFLFPYLLFGNYVEVYQVDNGTVVENGAIIDFPPSLTNAGTTENVGDLDIMNGGDSTMNGGDSIMHAQNRVRLKPGFHAHAGSLFQAYTTGSLSPDFANDLSRAPDFDGDGMPDILEEIYGLDPEEASDFDPKVDWDGDGQTNAQEIAAGTELGNPYDPVGTLPGEVSVNSQAMATYAIPIDVVPGTGGVQPDLSLIYNSQGTNGLFGHGWSLGGLSTISRVGTTAALEDANYSATAASFKNYGIKFDNTDKLSLDGQRLRVVSGVGTGVYFSDNTVYATEIDQFARITQYYNEPSTDSYFIAKTKDGLIMTYGDPPEQSTGSRYIPSGQSKVVSWALSKVEDRHGNQMTFNYTLAGGFQVLQSIEYSKNGDNWNGASVVFGYENITSKTRDNIEGYINGIKIQKNKRVSFIDIKESGQLIRRYELSYVTSSASQKVLLDSVYLRAYGEGGTSHYKDLPATYFDYSPGGTNSFKNGIYVATSNASNHLGSQNNSRYYPGDFNGDGRMDIGKAYKVNDSTIRFEVWYYLNGQFTQSSVNNISTDFADVDRFQVADFNGDGYTDYAFENLEGQIQYIVSKPDRFNYSRTIQIYLSNGSGFKPPISHLSAPSVTIDPADLHDFFQATDFNGDGRSEFTVGLWRSNAEFDIWPHYLVETHADPSSSSHYAFNSVNFSLVDSNLPSESNKTSMFADFNGDGMDDMAIIWGDKMRVYKSRGLVGNTFLKTSGNYYTQTLSGQSFQSNKTAYVPVDMNGDGHLDLVAQKDLSNTSVLNRLYLNKGNNTFVYRDEWNSSTHGLEMFDMQTFPGDYNADGITDLLFAQRRVKGQANAAIELRVFYFDGADSNPVKQLGSTKNTGIAWNNDTVFFPYAIDEEPTTDFLILQDSGGYAYPKAFYNNADVPDLLTKVTNGLGAETVIDWKPGLSLETIVTVKDIEFWNSEPADAHIVPADFSLYPVQRIAYNGMIPYAVKKDSGSSPGSFRYETNYTFADADVDLWGRGFIGFGVTTNWDGQRNQYRQDDYARDWPATGMVQSSLTQIRA